MLVVVEAQRVGAEELDRDTRWCGGFGKTAGVGADRASAQDDHIVVVERSELHGELELVQHRVDAADPSVEGFSSGRVAGRTAYQRCSVRDEAGSDEMVGH